MQSLIAIASGGLFGMGLGLGQAKGLIPQYDTDFVFAVVCEEFGQVIGAAVVLFYIVLVFRGCIVALPIAKNRFDALLSFGTVTALALQTFINIGGVIKFIPLTGATLPFMIQLRRQLHGHEHGVRRHFADGFHAKRRAQMTKLKRYLRTVTVILIAALVGLTGYFVYSVYSYGSRWYHSSNNTRLQANTDYVIQGALTDRYGNAIAASSEPNSRYYTDDAALRVSMSQLFGVIISV